MSNLPNAQFNFAAPDSLAVRVATTVRHRMFASFVAEFSPRPSDLVLDIGVTSDQTYANSNYFEALYPHKGRIIAAGIQDAAFLQQLYPGVRYLQADALAMPFVDGAFDLVHSSAVLEHVGSADNQARMVGECLRVARRGVCLTTPNRWFPIEFHTRLPLVHWLPKPACREIFRRLGYGPLAKEENLNLMTGRELEVTVRRFSGWRFRLAVARLLGWPSNLILFGHRLDAG